MAGPVLLNPDRFDQAGTIVAERCACTAAGFASPGFTLPQPGTIGDPSMVRPLMAALAACFPLVSPTLAAESPSAATPPLDQTWVAVHRETGLWSNGRDDALFFGLRGPGAQFQVASPQDGPRLHVWDPSTQNYAYINAIDVGPVGPPAAVEPDNAIPLEQSIWSGTARVTMYTCVELGGCNRTAMGIWPYEGVVAVDRRLIPLGSTVWIEGLGTFLAADTGSAIRGSRIDVFVHDYGRALQWGAQYLSVVAYGAP